MKLSRRGLFQMLLGSPVAAVAAPHIAKQIAKSRPRDLEMRKNMRLMHIQEQLSDPGLLHIGNGHFVERRLWDLAPIGNTDFRLAFTTSAKTASY